MVVGDIHGQIYDFLKFQMQVAILKHRNMNFLEIMSIEDHFQLKLQFYSIHLNLIILEHYTCLEVITNVDNQHHFLISWMNAISMIKNCMNYSWILLIIFYQLALQIVYLQLYMEASLQNQEMQYFYQFYVSDVNLIKEWNLLSYFLGRSKRQ
ncbi:unnamed protein product [Paramecium sonneborni]|uniref:Uncharacterized protein n=1 Tax=Paramecium sonneborni TaxID=65129 RepID=A0A8S1NQG8_9CILI|nr:unnamed protein product [Paramecium sonneborni]